MHSAQRGFRILAMITLLLNGLSATVGGALLVLAPDGRRLGLPVALLEGSPFRDFLVPGLVLLLANGLSSLCIAGLVLARHAQSGWMVLGQGLILAGWLSVQLMMLKNWTPALHLTCYGWAAILILSGWRLR